LGSSLHSICSSRMTSRRGDTLPSRQCERAPLPSSVPSDASNLGARIVRPTLAASPPPPLPHRSAENRGPGSGR
jgi:hypothetical protein